jgi:hypothetical protein
MMEDYVAGLSAPDIQRGSGLRSRNAKVDPNILVRFPQAIVLRHPGSIMTRPLVHWVRN